MVIKEPFFKIVWLHLFFAQKFNRKLLPIKSEKQRKRLSKYLKNIDDHFFFYSHVFKETLRGPLASYKRSKGVHRKISGIRMGHYVPANVLELLYFISRFGVYVGKS